MEKVHPILAWDMGSWRLGGGSGINALRWGKRGQRGNRSEQRRAKEAMLGLGNAVDQDQPGDVFSF